MLGYWYRTYFERAEPLHNMNGYLTLNVHVPKCKMSICKSRLHLHKRFYSCSDLWRMLWQKRDFSQSLEKTNMPTQSCKCFLFLLIQRGCFSHTIQCYINLMHKQQNPLLRSSKERISYMHLTASHIDEYLL